MAKFRCNQTGNIVEFKSEYDIKQMRNNTEYTEVKEEVQEESKTLTLKKPYSKE